MFQYSYSFLCYYLLGISNIILVTIKRISLYFYLIIPLSLAYPSIGQNSIEEEYSRDSLLAIEYYNIADTSFRNVDKCLKYTKMAIPLLKKTKQWDKYIYCLTCLSYCYDKKEYYDSMEMNNLFAMREAEKYALPNDPNYIAAVNNLGAVYSKVRQDHRRALKLFKGALSYFDEKNIDAGIMGTLLNNIGQQYRMMGDFDQAILYHKEALQFFQIAVDSLDKKNINAYYKIVEVYIALAKLYEFKGEYYTAIYYLEQELYLLNANRKEYDKSYFIYANVHLAQLSLKQMKIETTENYLRRATKFSQLTASQKAEIFSTTAKLYHQKGDLKKAAYYAKKALIEIPKEKVIEVAKALRLQSQIKISQEDYVTGITILDKAIALLLPSSNSANLQKSLIINDLFSKLDFIRILNIKAQALTLIYHKTGANIYLGKALQQYYLISYISDKIRQNYQSEESKIFLNGTTHKFYDDALFVAHQLYQTTGNQKYINDGLFFAEKSKASALLDELMLKNAEKAFAIPTATQEQFYGLRAEINYYNKLLSKETSKKVSFKKEQEWNSLLLKAKQEYEVLNDQIKKSHPNYYQLTQPKIISITEIQKQLLNNKQAFIEYFIGEKKAYSFVVTKEGVQWYVIDTSTKIVAHIQVLLKNLKLFEKEEAFVNSSHFLFNQLIQPIQFKDNISQLIIIPDAQLAYLPFELLLSAIPSSHNPKSFPFLIKDYSISYSYSGSILSNQHKVKSKPLGILAVAPVFKEHSSKYLKYSEDEISSLTTLDADVLLKTAAKKDSFLSKWANYNILHIASHASSSDDSLKQPTIDFWDEKLFLTDLYTYNASPPLVVLSACESGIGDHHRGEGVLSLARGFTYAGAHSLVTTLWKVNDKSTSEIVRSFYHYLDKGGTKDEALRQAKLSFIENCPDNKAAPYYWASFIQLGDSKAIDLGSKRNLKTFLMVGVGMLLFMVLILARGKRLGFNRL